MVLVKYSSLSFFKILFEFIQFLIDAFTTLKKKSSHSICTHVAIVIWEWVDENDREELKFSISKKIFDVNLSYSASYDLNNNETDLVYEEISIYYDLEYMLDNCLSINFSYKNNKASSDRDILPENSFFLTLKFKNLGEYGINSLF